MTAIPRKSLTDILNPALDGGSTPRAGLLRLLSLRALVTVASLVGALIFDMVSPLDIATWLLWALPLAVLASLAVGYWRMQKSTLISEGELLGHLLVDVLLLIVVLVYTGGASNPLISYLLVLLAVGATLLRQGLVNFFALLTMSLYTLFLVADLQSSPMPAANEHAAHQNMEDFQLHLVGMWVTFVVSAILITVFITRMAAAIRKRELTLAEVRENEMRNEQLVAIGTLAAGTAHALGTPLSTMSVVLTDLDGESEESLRELPLKADIHLLRQQVDRCKESLNQLTRFYNKSEAGAQSAQKLGDIAANIRDYLVNIHPGANIEITLEPDTSPIRLYFDLNLRHALINIIENAIKAARSQTSVHFQHLPADSQIEISVRDDGPGIPAQVMENLGEPFISTRKDSMGLGIFLANAAIQRSQGSIEMFNLSSGGSLVIIKLPVEKQNTFEVENVSE